MRVRDCPAAVSRNERRLDALVFERTDREATAIRSTIAVHACESEDLPTVPGAPRLAAHRLEEWASGRNGCRVVALSAHCDRIGLRPLAVITTSIEGRL